MKGEIIKKGELAKNDEVIEFFLPELPNAPGWVALPYKKQQALVQHTSRIQQNRQLRMLGEFGELMELHHVEELLEGEEMKMVDYLRRLYPGIHIRNIYRKQANFNEFVKSVPPAVLKRMSSISIEALGRFERIANAALGDIRNAIRELPALPASTDKAAEQYLERLDAKLSEHRSIRGKGAKLTIDEKEAAKMATNAVLHFLKTTKLKTSAEKRQFLTRVVGWVMEAQAVSGTLRAGRIPIPDGVIIRRGRPIGSKTKRKED